MKLLSLFSVSLVLSALGVAVAGDVNQQVEEAVVFYQQVENAKSIAIAIDDTDNNCSSCSGPCMSIAGVVTCCNDGESIINGKCTGGTSSTNKDDDDSDSDGGSDDDSSDSMSSSGNGDNCMTINGVKKCCSGTMTYNGKFHCSGEMSAAKGVNPMWMGMLLMMGILVQLY